MVTPQSSDLTPATSAPETTLQGARVREVPLDAPAESVLFDMISANDRWVAHFRLKAAVEDSPYLAGTYSYYELRP